MSCNSRPKFFTAAFEHALYFFVGTALYTIPAALLPREPLAAERAVKTCMQRGLYCENYPGFKSFWMSICVCIIVLVALSLVAHVAGVLSRRQPSRAGWLCVGKLATGAAVPLMLDIGLSVLPLFLAYGPDYQRDLALTVVANSRYTYVPFAGSFLLLLVAYAFIQAKAPETAVLVGSRGRASKKAMRQRATVAGVFCAVAYAITVGVYWADLPPECSAADENCQPVMGFIVGLAVAVAVFSGFYYAVLATPSLIHGDDARCWADAPLDAFSAGSSVPAPSVRPGGGDGFGDPTKVEGEYYQPGGGFGHSGRNYRGPAYGQGDPHGKGRAMKDADVVFYQE